MAAPTEAVEPAPTDPTFGNGVFERIAAWADREELVRAVLVTGSRAMSPSRLDRYSDYDVILYVADTEPYAGDAEWTDWFDDVLVSFVDRTDYENHRQLRRLVLYQEGTKIDFTIAPAAHLEELARRGRLPEELDLGFHILVDKDGAAGGLPNPTHVAFVPKPPTQSEFFALVEEFWWETTYVAKSLARGELLPAKYSLESVMKLDLLRRMLEWRMETEHGWSVRPGVWGRGLRANLDERTWRELEKTFVGADPAENWRALDDAIRLFRRVSREVADHLGWFYPEDLDRRVTGYLESVRRKSQEMPLEGTP